MISPDELDRIAGVEHPEPHRVLGPHEGERGVTIRVFRPGASEVRIVPEASLPPRSATTVHPAGIFEATYPEVRARFPYRVEVRYPGGVFTIRDPYAFEPSMGDVDYHLF